MTNRKERRKDLVPPRIQTKFIYKDKDELETRIVTKQDGRTIAYIQLEGYASTRAKDGS